MRVTFSNDHLHPTYGTCWGPRSIPDIELILIHAGSLALHLEKQTVQAEENDLLIIFPGCSLPVVIISSIGAYA